ncbi:iron-sulfur cluster assembly protein IscA [Gammaproteobacteria bacterium]|nr:iron-sulfur cluster assembly protein IscA [Gammaproteobacteria bacterium]
MSITITPNAKDHLKRSVSERNKGLGVRLGVKRTGCSGLAYLMEFVDVLSDEDEVYQFDEFKLVVDKKSLIYLKGTQLDYVKDGLNEGFEFTNPNVKNECGCGESFHV